MFEKLEKTVAEISEIAIAEERKISLNLLVDFIQNKRKTNRQVRLNFICTHNSRRSHLAQVWAQTMAFYFKIPTVFCYSGGTEKTSLFSKIAEVLENQGFEIDKLSADFNCIYSIKYSENEFPIIGFSKTYSDGFNPKTNFAAILTCTQSGGDCPFIIGAEKRIAIPYDDPKQFDNSILQGQKYTERSIQIASEMYYVFSKLN